MKQLRTYHRPIYLLGATYKRSRDKNRDVTFSDWNQRDDLTADIDVKNVRPIPYTPILIDALTDNSVLLPRFWGSDKNGRLCNLSYLSEAQEGQAQTLLRHNSPITTINDGQPYEMLFPPTDLIGQLAHSASTIGEIKDTLKSLYSEMSPEYTQPRYFTPSKISIKQLAAPYPQQHGQPLSPDEQNYNQWYQELNAAGIEFIEGFVVPSVNTISIVFSSDLYIGAEVSLIKYASTVDSQQSTSEQVLARGIVIRPNYKTEDTNSQTYNNTLPSVSFNLPSVIELTAADANTQGAPVVLADGFYGLRVQFFVEDYLKANERLHNQLPEVIKSSRLQFEQDKTSPVTSTEHQDCYTYELNEKVTFKSISGYGKLAIVCGDMIALEECLFYQFPQALPANYNELMTKTGKAVALNGTGVNTLGLSSVIRKNAQSLAEGFLKGGNPFSDGFKATMFSVSKGIWSDLEQKNLPEVMSSSVAFAFGISAFKESRTKLKNAIRFASHDLSGKQITALAFRKTVMDLPFIQREMNALQAGISAGTFRQNSTRLATSWFNGSLMTKFGRAFKIVDSATSLIDFYHLVEKSGELEKKSQQAQEDFDALSQSYLQSVSVVKAYQEWAQVLDAAKKAINDKGENIAHIVQGEQGLAIHINFKFNEWESGNQFGELRTDIAQVCQNLAQLLQDNPTYKVVIEGHAGRIGSSLANVTVAANRAKTVTDAIVKADSSLAERIFSASYGNTRPLSKDDIKSDMTQTGDDTPAAQDRRVEVRLIIPNYEIMLPPSRTGMIELEKARQLKQSLDVGLDDTQKAEMAAVLTTLTGFAMFTPLAPLAAGIMYLKTGAELADCALTLFDQMVTEKAYADFKARYKNIDQLNQLGKIHIRVLQAYRNLDVTIERSELKTIEEVEAHLKNKQTVKELQKRFLLRALALNGLVELLARIALWNPSASKLKSLLDDYRVKEYIDIYIINDNWEAPLVSYNTMAQNWIQKVRIDSSSYSASQSTLQSAQSPYSLAQLTKKARIQGEFNTGFPVQARLYQEDADDGFVEFAKMFDNNVETVKASDIGYSRMLIDTKGDGSTWLPFFDWLSATHTNRITPFTRVKIQIVLSATASKTKKKIFKANLRYCCERYLWDFKGPNFEVLMGPRTLDDMTYDSGDELADYFATHAIDDYLTCVEFEPTYWFGEYEIPGLKPLYSDYDIQSFEKWKKSNDPRHMLYYLTIDDAKISLAGPEKACTTFTYGVDDNNTFGQQCLLNSKGELIDAGQPLVLYDGLANKNVVLNESDLLIEEFVKSDSAKKSEGIPRYLNGNISTFIAVSKGSGFEWFDEKAPQSSVLDWSNDKPVSIYVALLSKGDEKDTYKRMMGDDYQVTMRLSVAIEEQDSFVLKDQAGGPSFLGSLLEVGEYTYKKEVTDPRAKAQIREINFTKTDIEQASELGSFVQDFQAKVNAAPTRYLDMYSDRSTLHVVKFELRYTSPTGRRVPTLRPFGPIIDKDKGQFLPAEISIASLIQVGIDADEGLYKLDHEYKLSVSGGQQYNANGMPWMEIETDASRMNDSAYLYWQKELTNNADKRKEWLEDWIVNDPTMVTAPQPKTV